MNGACTRRSIYFNVSVLYIKNFRFSSKSHDRRFCYVTAVLFVPFRRAQAWHLHVNEKQQKPDSWRGYLHSNHLSCPRFLNLLIEWLWFLVLITLLVKTKNLSNKVLMNHDIKWGSYRPKFADNDELLRDVALNLLYTWFVEIMAVNTTLRTKTWEIIFFSQRKEWGYLRLEQG